VEAGILGMLLEEVEWSQLAAWKCSADAWDAFETRTCHSYSLSNAKVSSIGEGDISGRVEAGEANRAATYTHAHMFTCTRGE